MRRWAERHRAGPQRLHRAAAGIAGHATADVLAPLRAQADANHRRLAASGWRGVELAGSIGSGKTTLAIRLTAAATDRGLPVRVVCGDCAGDDDARRVRATGATAEAIETGRDCHLSAAHLHHALDHLSEASGPGLLLVENVGNMVCPADIPLGCDVRLAVISATEGVDTIGKHRYLLEAMDGLIISRPDLAAACDVDLEALQTEAERWLGRPTLATLDLRHDPLPAPLLDLVFGSLEVD